MGFVVISMSQIESMKKVYKTNFDMLSPIETSPTIEINTQILTYSIRSLRLLGPFL